ncbi:hypothetical protein [Geoalkalibacter halelectricus]|uniref:hypothetical protein n=1 Tax=Geoalkalibacter halelectricus TaxID=2847045 RepID=UPI003D1A3551
MNTLDTINRPTLAEVEGIAALNNPIIRNLQITQCYFELSAVHAARLPEDANWCTFATWASRQAGQSIRMEDVEDSLERLMRSEALAARAARHLAGVAQSFGAIFSRDEVLRILWELADPRAALERVSAAVAEGNRKVFAEIGWEYARFNEQCLNDPVPLDDKIAAFCAQLRDGEPPQGQSYLRRAFLHYYRALFAADAKTRAELQFMANIEIGYHEQTRLQPEIVAALNAALVDPEEFTARLLAVAFPRGSLLLTGRKLLMGITGRPTPLQRAIHAFVEKLRAELRRIITAKLMVLELPGGQHLKLGEDLQGEFPQRLRDIRDPDLQNLLARVDPTPDSLLHTGAVDWANLGERLHFIVDLFRTRHEAAELFTPPFTSRQVRALKAGRLPRGRL